jgi:sarcosine oxidase
VPGFKLGRYHHLEETVDPDTVDRACSPRDEAVLRSFAEKYFPEGAGPTMALKTCMFTNSPDEHFIIDRHPEHPDVVLASPCSGHGFKFCSVVGEILADLALERTTKHDIGLFTLARFSEGTDGAA